MNQATAESLLDLAERAGPGLRGLDARALFEQLDRHYLELLAAMQWFIDRVQTDEALRMASALAPFWMATKRLDEGSHWFDRILEAAGGQDLRRGKASIDAGFLAFWRGEDERAAAFFNQALEIGQRTNEASLVAQALGAFARIALRSDVMEARRLSREALEISEGTADRLGRSNAIHVLGVAAQMAGDLAEARELMAERLGLMRELQNYAGISSEAGNLSMVERQLGNLERAEALARESLEIVHRRGDEWLMPYILSGLAAVATDRREFARAATLVGAAEALMEAQRAAWPPDERVHYERMLAALPQAMGVLEFDRARTSGRALSPSEAVAFALA